MEDIMSRNIKGDTEKLREELEDDYESNNEENNKDSNDNPNRICLPEEASKEWVNIEIPGGLKISLGSQVNSCNELAQIAWWIKEEFTRNKESNPSREYIK